MTKLIILSTIIYSLVMVASAAPRQYPTGRLNLIQVKEVTATNSCNQWVTVYGM